MVWFASLSKSRSRFTLLGCILVIGIASSCLCGHAAPRDSNVVIPGLVTSQWDDRYKGRVLLEELNCVACHAGAESLSPDSRKWPLLDKVALRLNPYYVERFIQSPHETKPGSLMPDVMSHLSAKERQAAAKAITHYLLSLHRSHRFDLQVIDTVAAEFGRDLFHSVGCVACHAPRDSDERELLVETSVPFPALESKYNVRGLVEFLRRPHDTRPSGRMPDMHLPTRDLERIAHYLLQETEVPGNLNYVLLRGRVAEGLDVNVDRIRAGHAASFALQEIPQLQHNSAVLFNGYLKIERAGEYTIFLEMNGGKLVLQDKEVVDVGASSRRGVMKATGQAKLEAGWNKIALTYIHAGREPGLRFEMAGPGFEKQPIPADLLSISQVPLEAFPEFVLDETLVESGKQMFAKLGCARCHDDLQLVAPEAPPLKTLDVAKGCLGEAAGPWPRFGLSPAQRDLLRATVPRLEGGPLDDRTTLEKTLVKFNCIACHERAGLGGVMPERDQYFIGSKNELGNQGRIPPTLTLVGAKLKKEWLAEVVLRGRRQRDYLATTMPIFGEANVAHVIDLFDKLDQVEKVEFEPIADLQAFKLAGHKLMGKDGFSCIACHDFNGQKATGPGAMDIIYSTERLQKDWFYAFMLNPQRFAPRTVMPAAWPGGFAFKQDILGGDTKKQIESLWVYLEDGERAKNPVGLSRQSPELRVTDEAVICRGRSNIGYRGIAVGYPERVSLAFDSEQMSLRSLWKGDFVTADNGRFNVRGRDTISFPEGIPFHRLETLDDHWPYKRKTDYLFPQDHGYQFRGYYLNARKRPTFMYRYGDIKVEEYFLDALDEDQNAYLKRTITLDVDETQQHFYFRAAAGKSVAKTDTSIFQADRLTVVITSDHEAIIRDGEPQELLVPLQLSPGRTRLTLEYKW